MAFSPSSTFHVSLLEHTDARAGRLIGTHDRPAALLRTLRQRDVQLRTFGRELEGLDQSLPVSEPRSTDD